VNENNWGAIWDTTNLYAHIYITTYHISYEFVLITGQTTLNSLHFNTMYRDHTLQWLFLTFSLAVYNLDAGYPICIPKVNLPPGPVARVSLCRVGTRFSITEHIQVSVHSQSCYPIVKVIWTLCCRLSECYVWAC